jgi:signal transduction histidine kinase
MQRILNYFSTVREYFFPVQIRGEYVQEFYSQIHQMNVHRMNDFTFLCVLFSGVVLVGNLFVTESVVYILPLVWMTHVCSMIVSTTVFVLLRWEWIQRKALRQQILLAIFVIDILGLGITISYAEQGTTNQIVTFAMTLFAVIMSYRFSPKVNVFLTATTGLFFIAGLHFFQPNGVILFSQITNIVITSLIALVVAQTYIRLAYDEFIQKKIIELQADIIFRQSQEVENINRNLTHSMTLLDDHMQEVEKQRHIIEKVYQENLKLQSLKDRFVKTAVHDLKNPLTGMMLIGEILQRGGLSRSLGEKEVGTKIYDVCRRILHVVNSLLGEMSLFAPQMLDISPPPRSQADSYLQSIYDDIAAAEFDTQMTVSHSTEQEQVSEQNGITNPQADERDESHIIEITSSIAEIVGNMKLLADKKQQILHCSLHADGFVRVIGDNFQRIIENIISNAIKYTHHHGNIQVRLHQQNEEFFLDIEDDGQGFTDEEMAVLFKGGVQSSRPTGDETSHGVGLLSVVDLLTTMGGEITVKSPGKNKGSIFTIRLPKEV